MSNNKNHQSAQGPPNASSSEAGPSNTQPPRSIQREFPNPYGHFFGMDVRGERPGGFPGQTHIDSTMPFSYTENPTNSSATNAPSSNHNARISEATAKELEDLEEEHPGVEHEEDSGGVPVGKEKKKMSGGAAAFAPKK